MAYLHMYLLAYLAMISVEKNLLRGTHKKVPNEYVSTYLDIPLLVFLTSKDVLQFEYMADSIMHTNVNTYNFSSFELSYK